MSNNDLLAILGLGIGIFALFQNQNNKGLVLGGGGTNGFLGIGDKAGLVTQGDGIITDNLGGLAENQQGDLSYRGTLTGIQDIDRAVFSAPTGTISGVEVRRSPDRTIAVFDLNQDYVPAIVEQKIAIGQTDVVYRRDGRILGATAPTLKASFTPQGAERILNNNIQINRPRNLPSLTPTKDLVRSAMRNRSRS